MDAIMNSNILISVLLALSLFLQACSDSKSNNDTSFSSDQPSQVEISEVIANASEINNGFPLEVNYTLTALEQSEKVLISFYLEPNNPEALDGSIDYQYFIGSQYLESLEEDEVLESQADLYVKTNLPNGSYRIKVLVDEHLDNDQKGVLSAANLELSDQDITQLRVVSVELEEPAIIIDPYVDYLKGMDADHIAELVRSIVNNKLVLNPSQITEITQLLSSFISEEELNAQVTVAVDGKMPSTPVKAKFQYSVDGGATWLSAQVLKNNLDAADSDLPEEGEAISENQYEGQNAQYASEIILEFEQPSDDEATDEFASIQQTFDLDVDIPFSQAKNIIDNILSSGNSLLDGALSFRSRILVTSGSAEIEHLLDIPLYIVPTNSDDVANLETLLEAAETMIGSCISNPVLCIAGSGGPVLPLSTGYQPLADGSFKDRVSEKHWQRSSGKKKKFKVGLEYDHKFAIYNGNPRSGYYGAYAKTQFQMPIYMFKKRSNLLDAYIRASAYADRPDGLEAKYTGYQYYFKVTGDYLFSGQRWLGSHTLPVKSFNKYIRKRIVSTVVTLGFIPFEVKAGVRGDLQAKVDLLIDQEDGITLENTIPNVSLRAYAEGGPTIGVASAGIGSSLGLVNNRLIASANLDMDYDSTAGKLTSATYKVDVSNKVKTIWGRFYLWAEKFNKRYSKTIYRTKPLRKYTYTLYSQEQELGSN